MKPKAGVLPLLLNIIVMISFELELRLLFQLKA